MLSTKYINKDSRQIAEVIGDNKINEIILNNTYDYNEPEKNDLNELEADIYEVLNKSKGLNASKKEMIKNYILNGDIENNDDLYTVYNDV